MAESMNEVRGGPGVPGKLDIRDSMSPYNSS